MTYYVIIAYDIPSDKRRTKLAKRLEAYGERQQWSVFEARLTREQYVQLRQDIDRIVNKDDDVVCIYHLTPETLKRTLRIGNRALPEKGEPYFV